MTLRFMTLALAATMIGTFGCELGAQEADGKSEKTAPADATKKAAPGDKTSAVPTAADATAKDKKEEPMPLTDKELREKLTPAQYNICIMNGTERPFANEFWNHKSDGIYYDVISGVPLFDSRTKFKSGSGWPSYFKAISEGAITLIEDRSNGMVRVEVRATKSGAHLGHLFTDGPAPTGQRFCINSAALVFVPRGEEPPKPLNQK